MSEPPYGALSSACLLDLGRPIYIVSYDSEPTMLQAEAKLSPDVRRATGCLPRKCSSESLRYDSRSIGSAFFSLLVVIFIVLFLYRRRSDDLPPRYLTFPLFRCSHGTNFTRHAMLQYANRKEGNASIETLEYTSVRFCRYANETGD